MMSPKEKVIVICADNVHRYGVRAEKNGMKVKILLYDLCRLTGILNSEALHSIKGILWLREFFHQKSKYYRLFFEDINHKVWKIKILNPVSISLM